MHQRWVGLCLLACVGCQLLGSGPRPHAAVEENPASPVVPAASNAAGDAPTAPDPPEADALHLAAECVKRGDQAGAVPHLRQYVASHPDHFMIRAYLAELLLRRGQLAEAASHFERFIADAQQTDGPAAGHLIHSHTRLMTIAQQRDDEYSERLHRGIGMYLLAQQASERETAERMLCKAAAELGAAEKCRPQTGRPAWYLYEVWTLLAQGPPARAALRRAHAAGPTDLTASERRLLGMTWALREPGR